MQALMLQNGDFFDYLYVAEATVPRKSFAAAEEVRDDFVRNSAGYFWRFDFRSSSVLLLERIMSLISLSEPTSRRLII